MCTALQVLKTMVHSAKGTHSNLVLCSISQIFVLCQRFVKCLVWYYFQYTESKLPHELGERKSVVWGSIGLQVHKLWQKQTFEVLFSKFCSTWNVDNWLIGKARPHVAIEDGPSALTHSEVIGDSVKSCLRYHWWWVLARNIVLPNPQQVCKWWSLPPHSS